MTSGYRALDEIGAHSAKPLGAADLELAIGLARLTVEAGGIDRKLGQQRGDGQRLGAVRMNQLAMRAEARGRPAVLLVHGALRRFERTCGSFERPRTQIVQQP